MPRGMPGDAQVSAPPSLDPRGAGQRRLPEVNVDKVQMVETLTGGLADRIARGKGGPAL